MKKLWQKFMGHLSTAPDRVRRVLVVIGLVGVGLIALTELLPRGEQTTDKTASVEGVMVTARQVEESLEQRITQLLGAVEGVGRCQVMVTLESQERAVYAADTTTTMQGEQFTGSERVLTVDTDTGLVGLLLTRIQPTIKGVVVVCDGASDARVSEQVSLVITTAFHISDRRVCVVKQKEGGNGR